MLRIVADDAIPFLRDALEEYAQVDYLPCEAIVRDTVKDADALIIRTRTICNRGLLEGSAVRCIASATIGFDHIDTGYCNEAHIHWSNAPGCNAGSVMQYVASALTVLCDHIQRSPRDMTLGIVGVGHVGSRVEKLAKALGMTVLKCDPPRSRLEGEEPFLPLGKLLGQSDIVTLHVPLQTSGADPTRHMMNDVSLETMKPGAWLINTSRGGVAETAALKKALRTGHLSGVILDVWEEEPLIDRDLLSCALIGTPHIAGYSLDGKANGTIMAVRSVAKCFDLPFDDWVPREFPADPPEIVLNPEGKTDFDIARETILHTYNIFRDDYQLKSHPALFEKQRKYYPVRREFHAYGIRPVQVNHSAYAMLKELGFRILPEKTSLPL